MQENWIGKIAGPALHLQAGGHAATGSRCSPPGPIRCSARASSRLPPITRWRSALAENAPELQAFIAECKRGGTTAAELETAEKLGFNTGLSVEHPLDPDWHLPVYVANFVLIEYGTGAIFGCPAHDQRDLDFARKYDLPVRRVVADGDETEQRFRRRRGLYRPGPAREFGLDGRHVRRRCQGRRHRQGRSTKAGARARRNTACATGASRASAIGARRSRSSTATTCGVVPVPKDQLPVVLPEDVDFQTPGNPLLRHPTWKHVACPSCGGRRRARPIRSTLSSTARGISCASPASRRDQPFDPRGDRQVAAGRAIYRRDRARDPAPALRPLLDARAWSTSA